MRQLDRTRERLIEIYRKKAKHYDITSRLYPVPGYPVRAQRLHAVHTLALRPGDSVVDVACGTGLNFPLIEQAIGPSGRIVGVDLTDAMLAQAEQRIAPHGWRDISLVQTDAAAFDFPTDIDAILSPYALTQVPSVQRSSPTVPPPSTEAAAGSCSMSRFRETCLGGWSGSGLRRFGRLRP